MSKNRGRADIALLLSPERRLNKTLLMVCTIPVVPRSGIRHARLDEGSGTRSGCGAADAKATPDPLPRCRRRMARLAGVRELVSWVSSAWGSSDRVARTTGTGAGVKTRAPGNNPKQTTNRGRAFMRRPPRHGYRCDGAGASQGSVSPLRKRQRSRCRPAPDHDTRSFTPNIARPLPAPPPTAPDMAGGGCCAVRGPENIRCPTKC